MGRYVTHQSFLNKKRPTTRGAFKPPKNYRFNGGSPQLQQVRTPVTVEQAANQTKTLEEQAAEATNAIAMGLLQGFMEKKSGKEAQKDKK